MNGTGTALRASEVFLSLQGEGPSVGTPAHFVRLQGCSVGCRWCDTRYAWDAADGRDAAPAGLLEETRALGTAPLLVVTGGEPLEAPALVPLLERGLQLWERVEVETSGLRPPPLSHPRLWWSVSPKLPQATPRWESTWRHTAAWLAEPAATFKLVVGDPPDDEDLLRLLGQHGIPAARVMLMPEGRTAEELRRRATGLADLCRRHGFRLSPRLQVCLWEGRRGA